MREVKKHSIYSVKYQNSLGRMLKLELISLYGRIFLNRKPKLKHELNFLHLGCGHNYFSGWINADYYQGLKFWKKYPDRPDWMLDLRYPLRCNSNVWDGVFTEHTLEHLYPVQVLRLLKELHRTMKPGAWIRITVPDLKKYVDYYCGRDVHENFSRWPTGCEAIRAASQSCFHCSLWDSHLLGRFLKECGFLKVQQTEYMKGSDRRLLRDSEARKWESLCMEARKPR